MLLGFLRRSHGFFRNLYSRVQQPWLAQAADAPEQTQSLIRGGFLCRDGPIRDRMRLHYAERLSHGPGAPASTQIPLHCFGGNIGGKAATRLAARISDISATGCYVDTINPLVDGTTVRLKILTEAHVFEAPATVVYSHVHLGMGLKFGEVLPNSQDVLQNWLAS